MQSEHFISLPGSSCPFPNLIGGEGGGESERKHEKREGERQLIVVSRGGKLAGYRDVSESLNFLTMLFQPVIKLQLMSRGRERRNIREQTHKQIQ